MDVRLVYTAYPGLIKVVFLLRLLFDIEEGKYILPKRRLTFNGLHGVISRKVHSHRCEDLKSNKSLYFDMCIENFL
jgi:hypothetical protein